MLRPVVLLVDDNPGDLELWKYGFAEAGITEQCIVPAADGFEAWELICRQKLLRQSFDVVISDYLLPRLSGIELVERIRADPTLRPTPIALVSGMHRPLKAPPDCGWYVKPSMYHEYSTLARTILEAHCPTYSPQKQN